MNYPNEWDLTLNGDTFNAMKSDFNQVLRKTLSNMERKGSELAELTVKLKISLKKDQAPDFPVNGTEMKRDIVIPKFDHKVSSVMQIKDEVTGTLGGNYELVWDAARGEYVMREIMDPQISIFECTPTRVYDAEAVDVEVEEEPAALEGRKLFGLPAPADENEEPEIQNEDAESEDDEPKIETDRERCARLYPACPCVHCAHNIESDVSACCSQHERDCDYESGCVDFEPIEQEAQEEDEPLDEEVEKRRAAIGKAIDIIRAAAQEDAGDEEDGYGYEEPEEA